MDDSGDTDGAIKEYKEAIRLAPDDVQAHYNLSISLAKKKDEAGALSELRIVEKLNPESPVPHIWLMRLLLHSDPKAALQECRTADELSHDSKLHELCEKLAAPIK
jgi:Flp pilus assembly protein TadD